MSLRRALVATSVVLAVPALTGCPNQNLYATPRTVPAGKVNIQASAEGVGLSAKTGTGTDSIYLPTLPSVGVRVGLADGIDIGARLSNLSSLQVDGKFNFIRSNTFDMAIDPGVQAAYLGSATSSSTCNGCTASSVALGLFYFNVPLVLGINFSHALTLVLTPGATILVATDSVSGGSGTSEFATGTAAMLRMGLGLNIRATDTVSIQPEFTLLRGFNSAEATLMNFGVGGNFGIGKGSGPDYSTVH